MQTEALKVREMPLVSTRHKRMDLFKHEQFALLAELSSNANLRPCNVQIDDFGAEMTPIARAAQPMEYGPPAVFLAHEPSSSNIVACILNVTGGMFM